MNPAYSVIFFTSASGAGYGLLAILGVATPMGLLTSDRWFGLTALVAAMLLISVGLVSSTLHLGRPERAWRAVTQFRSSWLSREGVVALITYLPASLFAVGWIIFESVTHFWGCAGIAASIGATLTVVCTAMIYRSLAAIPRWHHPLVLPIYLAFALMTGAICLNLLVGLFHGVLVWPPFLAIFALLLVWILKISYWRSIDSAIPIATVATATGLSDSGQVRLLQSPHTLENYLLKEMGYKVARKHAVKLRIIAQITAFCVPLFLLVTQLIFPTVLNLFADILAVGFVCFGVVLERWLFFAEAQHTVSLYYGETAI